MKAVISTDVLNVRTEPSTDAKIWTQIVKDEKYPVIDDPETPDGWLKIDLDSVDEEDGAYQTEPIFLQEIIMWKSVM